MRGFSRSELRTLRALSSPKKIQDYLDALPVNHEKRGETCYSPRLLLKHRKAHCLEAALFAAAALAFHGRPPLIMNLAAVRGDTDHAVALFEEGGLWGAISKTNHAVLRYRDPIYRTIRELALSYFHEYYLARSGKKTLRAYSKPVNLRRFGTKWMTAEHDLWDIAYALKDAPHIPIAPPRALKRLRPADAFERRITNATEWKRGDPRT